MLRRLALVLLLALAAAPAMVAAQATAAPPQLPPLIGLEVTGSARFSSAQLAAASGLQLHQPLSLDLLNQAVRRLRSSGEFSRVTYRYDYTSAGTHVQFAVTDQAKFVPVEFDNFPWLSNDQLLAWLRARLPLFTGTVPLSGGVDDRIAAQMEAWLKDHGIAGATVMGMPVQQELGGGFTGYLLSVSGVKMPVRQVAFAGAPPDVAADLQTAARDLIGSDFSRARLQSEATAEFLPALRKHGYLQAAIAAPEVAIADAASNAVSVHYAVTPGTQYRWGAIGFEGNAAFHSQELAGMVKLHSGDVADGPALDQDMNAIQRRYQHEGYFEAAVHARFDFSQPATAAATVVVSEGPLYHMGTLSFAGVSDKSAAELRHLWNLPAGQPFRSDYLHRYLDTITKRFNLQSALVKTTLHMDAQHQLVNVTITLTQP